MSVYCTYTFLFSIYICPPSKYNSCSIEWTHVFFNSSVIIHSFDVLHTTSVYLLPHPRLYPSWTTTVSIVCAHRRACRSFPHPKTHLRPQRHLPEYPVGVQKVCSISMSILVKSNSKLILWRWRFTIVHASACKMVVHPSVWTQKWRITHSYIQREIVQQN